MRSVTMTHKFLDLYAWPGLTNQWGCAQAAMDVTAVRSIAFPPFAQGEMNVAPLGSGGELLTGVLYVDGEYFAATKTPIDFVWQPDRVERRSVYKGLELKSTTIVPFKTMSVAVKFTVTNMTKARRKTEIKLAINGGATKSVKPWNAAYSPGEYDNDAHDRHGAKRGAVQVETHRSVCAAGSVAEADEHSSRRGSSTNSISHRANRRRSSFVNSLGESAASVQKDYDAIINNFDAVAKATTDEWNAS